MGFFSFLDAFRSKPRSKEHGIPLESPRRGGPVYQDTNSRHHVRHGSRTTNTNYVNESNNASTKRRSMSRRRSWFGGKPDADEDIPAMPTLVRTDYNHNGGIKSPTLGRSSRNNGMDYVQLPEDKRDKRTSAFATRQNVTAIGALPPMPTNADYTTTPATSTLPAEQRRSRRQSMKSLHRSNSQASTKSRRKSRSFWTSSNPDDEDEDVPPVPALYNGTSPDSITRNDPFDDDDDQTRGRARSSTHGEGQKQPRPVSTASRRSYVPKSAASGFLKSTNGASETQRKSYRRSFNLGEGVELVCVTDEHRIEWEKLMNKHAKMEDSVFDSNDNKDGEEVAEAGGNRFSNAQALAALEFGVRT